MNEVNIQKPEVYYSILENMYLENIDLSTDLEIREAIKKINHHKKDVLDLKREVNHDIRIIRTMYLDESMIDNSKILGVIPINRNLSPIQKRKKLINERDKTMGPYNEIINIIDDYLKQIDEFENYIKNEL